MTDPILFFLAAQALLATPGPTNTLLATSSAQVGVRASLPLVGAELAGYLLAISIYRLALAPVLAAYPLAGTVLKIAAAVFVAWLALRLWRSDMRLAANRVEAPAVFVATLLNPKALIAALTILPAEHPAMGWYIAAFGGIVAVSGIGWVVVGRLIAGATGPRHSRLVPRVASVVLASFAGLLAASAFH